MLIRMRGQVPAGSLVLTKCGISRRAERQFLLSYTRTRVHYRFFLDSPSSVIVPREYQYNRREHDKLADTKSSLGMEPNGLFALASCAIKR